MYNCCVDPSPKSSDNSPRRSPQLPRAEEEEEEAPAESNSVSHNVTMATICS